MTHRMLFGLACVLVTAPGTWAQENRPTTEDPVHDELRAVRDDMLAAFQERDIDRMLKHVHKDAVVTFQNAELCRGPDGVRAFYQRMMEGDDREVKSVKSDFKVDELSILYGDDTAVAFGTLNDDFALKGGMDFSLASRWTATLVKEDGRWQIAAYHVSTNMFDNGVSNLLVKWAAIKAGAVALLAGLFLGAVVTKVFTKSRNKPRNDGAPS